MRGHCHHRQVRRRCVRRARRRTARALRRGVLRRAELRRVPPERCRLRGPRGGRAPRADERQQPSTVQSRARRGTSGLKALLDQRHSTVVTTGPHGRYGLRTDGALRFALRGTPIINFHRNNFRTYRTYSPNIPRSNGAQLLRLCTAAPHSKQKHHASNAHRGVNFGSPGQGR